MPLTVAEAKYHRELKDRVILETRNERVFSLIDWLLGEGRREIELDLVNAYLGDLALTDDEILSLCQVYHSKGWRTELKEPFFRRLTGARGHLIFSESV